MLNKDYECKLTQETNKINNKNNLWDIMRYNDKCLDSFVKKIASIKNEDWDALKEDEKNESYYGYSGIDYLIYSNSLSRLESSFSNLNKQEKYRFYKYFSESRETAVIAGRLREFNRRLKSIKSKYLFVFRRAFKKNDFLVFAKMAVWSLPILILNSMIENPTYKAMIAILAALAYLAYLYEKSADSQNEQIEVIIRTMKEKTILDLREHYDKMFRKMGWLKKDS